ncbi:MAG: hypothetical protein ACRDB9_07645 [Cetobacterium sp.]
MIEVTKYFRNTKHPLGDGIYSKITLGFENEVDAEIYRNKKLEFKDGIVVEEISKEEYESETEKDEE